ncbi:MAG TPA: delta-60 repeat domain-containing protein, partial [Pyrinomonadaceae bacterium]|nr:delta-60 repeat domain-containing protein [Pyrinomonadaceae bacterium]
MKNLMNSILGKLSIMSLAVSMFLIGLPFKTQAASSGALDTVAITNIAGADAANDIAIQADGKIVLVGSTNNNTGGAGFDFAIVRYNADGTLDTTFDTDGKISTDFGGIDFAFNVEIQDDGKIVVTGTTDPVGTPTSDFAIARYNTNGSLDTTFDTDGKVTTDFFTFNDSCSGMTIQAD